MAAAAALCVAAAGRGDLLFLGGLLALALADRRSSTAAVAAACAVAVRWGTTSLDTVTGAATTLGPGVRVGPPLAAAALALAALALLLSGLEQPLLPRLAAGATAGALAVGPVGAASVGAVVLGLLGVILGMLLASALPRLAAHPSDRLRTAAPVAAVAAVAMAVIW